MGALDTISQMLRIKSLVDQQRGSQITPDMKYIASQKKQQQEQELSSLKYITNKYTDLYFKANKNRALQENILGIMQGMKNSLPPAFRQQFDLFTKTGPFSEVAEKKRKWYEIKGPPPKPLTDEQQKDLSLVADREFKVADYNYEMQHFLTGQAPPSKPRSVGLKDGFVGIRGENGVVHVTTDEMLAGEAEAKKLDQNFGMMLANDFKVKGETTNFVSDGQEYTTTKYYDHLKGKNVTETKAGKQLEPRKHWESPLLTEVLAYVSAGISDKETPGGAIAKRVLDFVTDSKVKDNASLEAALNTSLIGVPKFNNIYLSIRDKDFDTKGPWYNPGDWFGQYGLSKNATIIPIYGESVEFKTSDNQIVGGRWDRQMDIVYNAQGQSIGSYNDAVSIIGQKHSSELKRRTE